MRAEDSALRARSTPRVASAQSGAPRPRRAPARSPDRARLAGPPRTPGSAPRRARAGLDHRSKDPSAPAPAQGGRDTTARPATRLRTARRACARRLPRVSGRPRRCAPRRRASWRRSPRRGGPAWRPCDGAAGVTPSWRVRRSLRGHRPPCNPRVTARQLGPHLRERAAATDQSHERHVEEVGGLVDRLGTVPGPPQLFGLLPQLRRQQPRVPEQFRGSRSRLGPGGALRDGACEVVEIERRRPAGPPIEVTEPGAALPYGEAQRIAVTVQVHAHQLLRVARRSSLLPQRLARARPVNAFAPGDRARERLTRAPDQPQGVAPFVARRSARRPPPLDRPAS